jgi:hypothetical protein
MVSSIWERSAFYGFVLPHEGIVAEPKQHDDHPLGQGDDPEVQWNRRSRNRTGSRTAMRPPSLMDAQAASSTGMR